MATRWLTFKETVTTIIDTEAIDTLADLVSLQLKSGVSQKEFAERIGMKQPQLAKIERLDYKVTLNTTKDNQPA